MNFDGYKPPSELLCDVDDGGSVQAALRRLSIRAELITVDETASNYAGAREAEGTWRAKHEIL